LEPAVAAVQRALTLNDAYYLNHIVLGYISLNQQQYEQALAEMERAVALDPHVALTYAALAEALSRVGRAEDALEAAEVLRINPNFSLEVHKQREPIKDPAVLERHLTALRKAGLQ